MKEYYVCANCRVAFSDLIQGFEKCPVAGCEGSLIPILPAFAEAIKILREKGYKIAGCEFPRLDGKEKNYLAIIVFSQIIAFKTLPPLFQLGYIPEDNAVYISRSYRNCSFVYEDHVKRSANALRRWARELPARE